MARYERTTTSAVRDVLRIARDFLPQRIPLEPVSEDRHSVTLKGGDGTVTISAHRHGLDTIVDATTDQVSTSRIDIETQHYLNQLPYQPGDRPGLA